MDFWKSYVCSNKLGCARNKLLFLTAQQNPKIISLDAGLRLDGIPALDLWDLIVFCPWRHKDFKGITDVLNNIDCVPSNVQSSHHEDLLYVFEDNEAVIKMIIKGRSPTMRHVSKTHKVALDWLFDRINLGPKNPNQVHRHQKPSC